jgi:hypothetical protein
VYFFDAASFSSLARLSLGCNSVRVRSVPTTDPITSPKMGPKKDKTKNKINSNKCPFFDRRYCKNCDECDKKHPDKVCDDNNCYGENCDDKRHPNPCKFGTTIQ